MVGNGSHLHRFNDFLSSFYPENRSKAVRKTDQKAQKNLPGAFPEKLEIANKPVNPWFRW